MALFISCMALLMCLVPSSALAQAPVTECGAERGTFSLVPADGPAGSAFTVTGSITLLPTLGAGEGPATTIISSGPIFEVLWVETGMSGATLLGNMPSTYDDVTFMASFSGGFLVPATSAPGQHQVAIKIVDSEMTPACEDFMVTAVTPVQQDAYVQTATTLPSTGSTLFGLAIGLLALITGVLVWRGCRHPESNTDVF